MCRSQAWLLSLPVDSTGCYLFHAKLALTTTDSRSAFKLLLVWLCILVSRKKLMKARGESKPSNAGFYLSWPLLVTRLLCPPVLCSGKTGTEQGPLYGCLKMSSQLCLARLQNWWVPPSWRGKGGNTVSTCMVLSVWGCESPPRSPLPAVGAPTSKPFGHTHLWMR